MPSLSDLIWCTVVFAAFGFSVCLHEFGHALVAYWGGDRSVKDKGYLPLNPMGQNVEGVSYPLSV